MSALYTAKVTVTGGRTGHIKSTDGLLELDLAMPKELGGKGGATNPEQLFAAGYGACFESALQHIAKKQNIPLKNTEILATVELHSNNENGFKLAVSLAIEIQGIQQQVAEELVNHAHQVCPYSNAIRNNVDVRLSVTTV